MLDIVQIRDVSNILIHSTTAQSFAREIHNNNYFSFARYGDGEWYAMLGDPNSNCDKHLYFKEMGSELTTSLQGYLFGPNYYLSIMELGLQKRGSDIVNLINSLGLVGKINWFDTYDMANFVLDGSIKFIIDELNHNHNIILIGPDYLNKLDLFPIAKYIVVPDVNCYLDQERILKEIENYGEPGIYMFSASMLTEVLIYKLYSKLPQSFLIDFGAIWDPFVGKNIRDYHIDPLYRKVVSKYSGGKG